jgi:hypothetical protein
MKKILLFTCLILISGMLYARSGSIPGKISDADTDVPLPEANVIIKSASKDFTTVISGPLTLLDLSHGS